MPTTRVITAPTSEAVTLDELKAWARVDGTSEDALLATLGKAARRAAEQYTSAWFAPVELETTFRADEPFVLPTSAGAPTAVSGLIEDLDGLPAAGAVLTQYLAEYQKGIIINREADEWNPGTYTVSYPAGYAADELPDDIKTAILITMAALYDDRGGDGRGLPARARALLDPYRVLALA